MSQHPSAPNPAESRLEKSQRQAQEGAEARAEHDAKASAVLVNTARLKELRLDKERTDKAAAVASAAALAAAAPANKPRRRSTKVT